MISNGIGKKICCFYFIRLVCPVLLSAQTPFAKLDHWMDENTKDMGGRTILVIYKDGKIIYNRSVLDMSRRQKTIVKYVARKQGMEANLDAYTINSQVMIASSSKWYSAALVMTFVDEGKLRLSDTVGNLAAHSFSARQGRNYDS